MQRFIISPLFALSRFFINIYGIFLKFFLKLNGGYWSRIGLAENITEERIKKRPFYRSFLNGDDRKEIYLIIRLRIFLEISFECKIDYSILHALQTTSFLK